MMLQLPVDILHLICSELASQRDFDTLYNCTQTNKQLAAPAFTNLYSIAHHSKFFDASSQAFIADQEALIQKWAILWRTIILSSFERSFFPYCRYLRALDLNDLGQLFEFDKFRGKIEKKFFEGDLSHLHIVDFPRSKLGRPAPPQLNINAITDRVGDVVTDKAPLLEALYGNGGLGSSSGLKKWIPKLNKLQELRLFKGEPLGDEAISQLVNANCPLFRKLGIYIWLAPDSDNQLATFLSGLPTPSLQSLELFSITGISDLSFAALASHHAPTLTHLRLSVKPDACPHLALLAPCTALTQLILEDSTGSSDLERSHPADFTTLQTWLGACHGLRQLEFHSFPPAAALITPLLEQGGAPGLHTLQVEGYVMRERRSFHEALARQAGLRTLALRGDAEGCGRDDADALCEAVCEIGGLRDLKLRGVSEYFRNGHVSRLAGRLLWLEHLYVEGWLINDEVWEALGGLRHLQGISFYGVTTFTKEGLMGFVRALESPGNDGIVVMVDNADTEERLTEDEQTEVKNAIGAQVNGRFEYTLYRDPDEPEFEGESD